MDRALRRVYELLPNADRKYCVTAFQQFAAIKNSQRKFKLVREASDAEQSKDYLAEIKFGAAFQYLNFDVEAEPLGDRGPDFRVSEGGNEAYLEVRRLRPVGKGPPPLSADLDLGEYGDFEREVQKCFGVITDKMRQLRRTDCILAIWNDDEDIDEVSMEHAVGSFIETHLVPPGLCFVLFGSKRRNCASHQKLYCFPVRPLNPHEEKWRMDLERL